MSECSSTSERPAMSGRSEREGPRPRGDAASGAPASRRTGRRAALLRAAVSSAALIVAQGPAAQPGDSAIDAVCAGDRVAFELPPFGRFDADGDRSIGAREAASCDALATLFDRLDLDADGWLTRVEYSAFADLWQRRKRVFGDDADTP